MIIMYKNNDDDEIVRVFDNVKECAGYFETSVRTMYTMLCKIRKGKRHLKLDKKDRKFYRLCEIKDSDLDGDDF